MRLVVIIAWIIFGFLASKELPPFVATARGQGEDYATISQASKWRLRGVKCKDTITPTPPPAPGLAGTLEPPLGEVGAKQERSVGVQLSNPQVKGCLCLGFCLKTHYGEMVGVGETL